MKEKLDIALERLTKAVAIHNPIGVYGLFSGGHDSFCASYLASLHPQFSGILHINTGIGIEATRAYVRDTCAARGWKLFEYKAAENINAKGRADPQNYEDLVLTYGFPGPHGHGMMYQRLKQRQLERFERDIGASSRGKVKRRVLYVSGCRKEESERRMANTEECQIEGRRIWTAPLLDWTKLDTSDLLVYVQQPRNLVVDLIHKSGECLCGAFAKEGELEELNLWDITRPAYEQLKALEVLVKEIYGWGWEGRPKKYQKKTRKPGPLCWSCTKGDIQQTDESILQITKIA